MQQKGKEENKSRRRQATALPVSESIVERVHVLKIVGEKLTKTGWKFTVNPCDVSNSGVWRNLTTLEGSEDIVYAAATELYATSLTYKTK
ncbi:unnamed protein product [Arabidopsis thaliana]|uniref:Uncharacterized protein n=1 Tax=Arabidopsis thaliana TaxID=3702 RepID=A0A5S9WJR4_ARATH|nr:unnamed protein product [Arabidopsis thaliana]